MANRIKDKTSKTIQEDESKDKQRVYAEKSTTKSTKKNTEPSDSRGFIGFIKSAAFQRIVGLLLITFSFFLLVSFISYFNTWKSDQDKILSNDVWSLLTDKSIQLDNWLNKLGGIVSHFFFFNGFGVASFFFVPFFFCIGTNLLIQQRIFRFFKVFRYVFFWTIWSSIAFSFVLKAWFPMFPFGGAFGDTAVMWANSVAGSLGAGIAIVVALISALILKGVITDNAWLRLKEIITGQSAVKDLPNVSLDTFIKEEENDSGSAKKMINEFYAERNKLINEQDNPTTLKPEETPFLKNETPPETIANKAISANENEIELDNFDIEKTTPLASPNTEFEVVFNDDNNDGFAESVKELELTKAESAALADIEEVTQQDDKADFEIYDPTLDLRNFKFPTIDLLEHYGEEKISINKEELEKNKDQIIATLLNFKIEVSKIKATVGPTVTLYEIVPAPGVRISKIKNLEDDIALSLSALGIRIIAPIPGKGTIGIEVPNAKPETVSMRTILDSDKFKDAKMALPLALGKNIANEVFVADLAKMPHLLIAGATGQGKSVGINAIITSLLYKKHPSELKIVMVDPKKVELSLYSHIERHYLAILPGVEEPIITDTSKVVNTLNALCIEMDNRYELLKDAGVRNLREYNEKFQNRKLNPMKGHRFLPYIVLIVDEFADLIMTAGKEVEMPIARLAQLARAIGIHLIIATQRPSVNVITGIIKANFPARIAFKVTAKVDSRTILDQGGADQLIGRGDMLLSVDGNTIRLQCAFIDTPEVSRIVDHISAQQGYPEAYLLPEYVGEGEKSKDDERFDPKDIDPLFEDAARVIVQNQQGSTSLIQRRLKLGYNRAGRLMDQLESAGIVGPNAGSKAREVLITTEFELDEFLSRMK